MNPAESRSGVYLHPGLLLAAAEPTLVTTVLGSCVAVCLFDPATRIGGINHFVLPLWNAEGLPSPKYGSIALPKLLERLRGLGARAGTLRAKLFGGSAVFGTAAGLLNVGERNVELAERFLERAGIPVAARDTGGTISRKIIFTTDTGEVLLRRIRPVSDRP